MSKPDYDTTLARIAGNIAGGFLMDGPEAYAPDRIDALAKVAVQAARAIVAEVKRTQPADAPSAQETKP